jgi:hypothetical protein
LRIDWRNFKNCQNPSRGWRAPLGVKLTGFVAVAAEPGVATRPNRSTG